MLKKWWHFVKPEPFWYCFALHGSPPTVKHDSYQKAKKEALRIAQMKGTPVFVLKAQCVILPCQPKPLPAMEIYYFNETPSDYVDPSTPLNGEISCATWTPTI